jgi:hypothetical protein
VSNVSNVSNLTLEPFEDQVSQLSPGVGAHHPERGQGVRQEVVPPQADGSLNRLPADRSQPIPVPAHGVREVQDAGDPDDDPGELVRSARQVR